MKASVSLYKNDGEGANGFPVKLIISHQKKTRRKTIGYASLDFWDEVKDIPSPAHPDFENLYGAILDIQKKSIKQGFRELHSLDAAFAYLLGEVKVKSVSLLEYFKKEIARQRSVGRNGNADSYFYAQQQIEKFAPETSLSEITPAWVERFKNWKRDTVPGIKDSTLKNYLSVLSALYNTAVRDPQIRLVDLQPFKDAKKGLVVKVRRKKNRYLEKKQLLKMQDPKKLDRLTATELRAVRLSLLQFYLGGANLKDVYFLKENQFFKDRVMLVRSKMERYDEEFDVRVFPEAKNLIELLRDPADGYLFPWRKTHLGYKTFRRNHYRELASAQIKLKLKLSPIDQVLNSNTFRHTFATLAKFEGIDVDIIRELMGHERNDIDTAYKDKFPEAVRDAAHLRIINL